MNVLVASLPKLSSLVVDPANHPTPLPIPLLNRAEYAENCLYLQFTDNAATLIRLNFNRISRNPP